MGSPHTFCGFRCSWILPIAGFLILLAACGEESGSMGPSAAEHSIANDIGPPPGDTPPPGSTTQQIAFVSNRDGNYEIYRMWANGSGLKRLTFNRADDLQPAWSPDGQKLAFVRSGQIHAMSQNGGGQANLSNSTTADADPVWSPDGQKILFRRYLTVGSGWVVFSSWEVFVMNADGSGQTNLSTYTLAYDGNARWSPDGTQIVFVSQRDGNREIYRMDADGSDKARLTTDPLEDFSPQWRPGGDRIAFLRGAPSNRRLYFIDADGSNLVEPNPALVIRWLTWSPDGTRLAAVDDEMGLHLLTAEGASVLYDSNADTHDPIVWSPDGLALAMTGPSGSWEDIFILTDADLQAGTAGANITNSLGSGPFNHSPAWRP